MHYKTLQPSIFNKLNRGMVFNNQKDKVLQNLFLLHIFLKGSFAPKNYDISKLDTLGYCLQHKMTNTMHSYHELSIFLFRHAILYIYFNFLSFAINGNGLCLQTLFFSMVLVQGTSSIKAWLGKISQNWFSIVVSFSFVLEYFILQ